MKRHLLVMVISALSYLSLAAQKHHPIDTAGFPIYVSQEGDEQFILKQYFFVMLTRGTSRDQPDTLRDSIQAGHLAHLNSLAEEGKLCIAGPFGDDGDWRGILILNAHTEAEAREIIDQDPAVQAGILGYTLKPWWGGIDSRLH